MATLFAIPPTLTKAARGLLQLLVERRHSSLRSQLPVSVALSVARLEITGVLEVCWTSLLRGHDSDGPGAG
jgi:hypothetical protein